MLIKKQCYIILKRLCCSHKEYCLTESKFFISSETKINLIKQNVHNTPQKTCELYIDINVKYKGQR